MFLTDTTLLSSSLVGPFTDGFCSHASMFSAASVRACGMLAKSMSVRIMLRIAVLPPPPAFSFSISAKRERMWLILRSRISWNT